MFYVARGSFRPRHTQHRAPDGSALRGGAVRRRGLHRPSRLLYHLAPPTQTHKIEPVAADSKRPTTVPSPPAHQDRQDPAEGRRRSGPHPAVLQQRRGVRRRPPGRPDARNRFYRNGDRRRDAVRPRGHGRLRDGLRRPRATARATTSCCRSGRPGDSTRTRARPADPVPRGAVRDRAAEALPQRLRPAARALAVLPARPPRARVRASHATSTATSSSTSAERPDHRLPLPPPPVRRRRLGRLPVAVPVQHRGLPADHRAASTSRRRSTRRSRPGTSSSARSCPASSTTTRSRSRRRTTTRTSTATRSSTTSPATS